MVVEGGKATVLPFTIDAEHCVRELSPTARQILTDSADVAVLPFATVPCALLGLHVALVGGTARGVAEALRRRDPCGRGAQLFQLYVVDRLIPDPPDGVDPRVFAARMWAPHCTGTRPGEAGRG